MGREEEKKVRKAAVELKENQDLRSGAHEAIEEIAIVSKHSLFHTNHIRVCI